MRILIFDPSGSFREGKGTSGYCLYEDGHLISVASLRAEGFKSRQEYFKEHKRLINKLKPNIVVAEGFRLYKDKAIAQSNSEMETPRLLGYLEMVCYEKRIRYVEQPASIKSRFTDAILERKGILSKGNNNSSYILNVHVSGHVVDAVRHGEYFLLKERKNNAKSKDNAN